MKFPGKKNKESAREEESVNKIESITKIADLNESAPQVNDKNMIRRIPWTLWISSGLVIMALLFFGTIMLMVTPTDSASEFRPLVRPRASASVGEEGATTDSNVQDRIKEIFNRTGFSNPDPDPNEFLDESPPQIETRIDSPSRKRTRRPLRKISDDFDPRQSYVKKHPNGTLEFLFPEPIPDNAVKTAAATDHSPLTDEAAQPISPVAFRSRRCLLDNCTSNPTSDSFVFPNDYPEDMVNEIMAREAHRFAGLFGNDLVIGAGDNLVPRFDTSDDIDLCRSQEMIQHPRHGITIENKTVLVVNTRNYTQGVRVEKCQKANEPCEELRGLLSIYKTECKQIYHYRTLVVYDPKTQNTTTESIRLPSCCKCVLKQAKLGEP